MSDPQAPLPDPENRPGLSRFLGMTQSAPMRLESSHAVSGEQTPLEFNSTARATPSGKWSRKAIQWAFAGSLGVVAAYMGAQITHAPHSRAPSAASLADAHDAAFTSQGGMLGWVNSAGIAIGAWRGQDQIAQARAAWEWAGDRGFYAASEPAIDNFSPDAAVDADAGGPQAQHGEALTNAASGAPLRHVSRIQISKNAGSMGMTSDLSAEDIEFVVWHEGYHADAYQANADSRLGGSLAQGETGQMWRAAVWGQGALRHAPGLEKMDPDNSLRALDTSRNIFGIYQEGAADAFAVIVMAHKITKEEWNRRILHLQGARIANSLAFIERDPHETQESIQILAALGHDKLAALTPKQSRLLAEAVGSDNLILASQKQGWAYEVLRSAQGAGVMAQIDVHAQMPLVQWAANNHDPAMKEAATAWGRKSEIEQKNVNLQWLQEARAWRNGAHLDYSAIAPGLSATLPAHAANSDYETRTGTGYPTDSDNQPPASLNDGETDALRSQQGVRALNEWRDTAVLAGELDGSKIEATKDFKTVSAMLDEKDKETLSGDPFWNPLMNEGLAGRMAQRRVASEMQKVSAQPAGKTPKGTAPG